MDDNQKLCHQCISQQLLGISFTNVYSVKIIGLANSYADNIL